MWRMNGGDRVVTESEWALVRVGLDLLWDGIEDDFASGENDTLLGVKAFDVLTPEQKLALLADVATALRDAAIPTPRHTAVNEGAVAAVFAAVRDYLEVELDPITDDDPDGKRDPTEVRRLIRAAAAEGADDSATLPPASSNRRGDWGGLLELIEGRVLWDDDYALGDQFLDLPPGEARVLLDRYGIDPDYFLAFPSDPDRAGLIAARQALARLLDRPVPDSNGLYPTLADLYRDLAVGPCSPIALAKWAGHPWVEVVYQFDAAWEIDYPLWEREFAGGLPAAPFDLSRARETVEVEWPEGVRVERGSDGWVVQDEDGAYWCDALHDDWTDEPNDDLPALSFASAEEARAAFLRATRLYTEREARHEVAVARIKKIDQLDSMENDGA